MVGCGTGGPTAAALLARHGHHVTVFERFAQPKPVGAGILLQPSGLAVLNQLGVLDQTVAVGSLVHKLRSTTRAGRTILDLDYEELASRLCGLGINRPALLEVLLGALDKSGAELRLGCDVRAVERSSEHVRLRDSSGGIVGQFDLVVVADGARSALRDASPVRAQTRNYKWGAVWTMASDPHGAFAGQLRQHCHGTKQMLGFLPSGTLPGQSTPCVSMFWSSRKRQAERSMAGNLDALKREILSLAPSAEPIVDQLHSPDQLTFAQYFDTRLASVVSGRVVYLGDAAHAMSPQLGQGANLAMLDAASLADALSSSGRDLAESLQLHARSRKSQVAYYQMATRALTPFFQSSLTPISWPRDILGAPVNRVRPLRREMVANLVGIKQSPFKRSSLDGLPHIGK